MLVVYDVFNDVYDIKVFENLLRPFAWNERSRRFRKSPLRKPFSKICVFGAQKTPFTRLLKANTEKKSPFSN